MKCKKYMQKNFWKKHLCALQVFLCALVSWPMCEGTLIVTNSCGIARLSCFHLYDSMTKWCCVVVKFRALCHVADLF